MRAVSRKRARDLGNNRGILGIFWVTRRICPAREARDRDFSCKGQKSILSLQSWLQMRSPVHTHCLGAVAAQPQICLRMTLELAIILVWPLPLIQPCNICQHSDKLDTKQLTAEC